MSAGSFDEQEYPQRSFLGRAINIILQPGYEWLVVRSERNTKENLLSNYLLPLLFLGESLTAASHYRYNIKHLPEPNYFIFGIIILFIFDILISIFSIYAVGVLIKKISLNFGGSDDEEFALALSNYGFTSLIIAAVISKTLGFLVDSTSELSSVIQTPLAVFAFVMIFYSVYTISKGAEYLLSVEKGRILSFYVALFIVVYVGGLAINTLTEYFEFKLASFDLIPDRAQIQRDETESTQKLIDEGEKTQRALEKLNESLENFH